MACAGLGCATKNAARTITPKCTKTFFTRSLLKILMTGLGRNIKRLSTDCCMESNGGFLGVPELGENKWLASQVPRTELQRLRQDLGAPTAVLGPHRELDLPIA